MTDESQGRSADTTWKAERDAIADRNAAVRKRAQADKKVRARALKDEVREDTRREREQLEALNARLDRQQFRGRD